MADLPRSRLAEGAMFIRQSKIGDRQSKIN
jgi:hypothetical protein